MTMPEVSVIIPTRDRPQLLARALGSVVRQTFGDLQVIVVDNNRDSGPVTANIAVAELLRDPRVRVVDGMGSRSAAMSRNRGLEVARGTWIAFLDDDDEYRPEKIAAQHALALRTGAPFVVCGYEFVWPNRTRRRQCDAAQFSGDEILARANLGSPLLFHRRDDTIRFDETLTAGEDVPYALRHILKQPSPLIPCVPEPLVVVHPQPAGQNVHADKAAVWRAYRATWKLARGRFSRRARQAFLAQGRLERAMGGYGDAAHFTRAVASMLRARGLREWRFAAFAVLARLRRHA
jgi:glycosyltransferase involved in cell wall biosynthesis